MKNVKKLAVTLAALSLLVGSSVASAQTTTPTTTPTTPTSPVSTTTPGVPNTGAGDAALNWLLLASSGAVILAGIAYLTRKPETR